MKISPLIYKNAQVTVTSFEQIRYMSQQFSTHKPIRTPKTCLGQSLLCRAADLANSVDKLGVVNPTSVSRIKPFSKIVSIMITC
ncbi:MAG: hypothetical protein MUO62_11010 [Anaerolineales bacterium]|nr:hypothetical protein [Anaerolineales bacterium]